MKRMKRALSLAAVLTMAASMLAVYLPTSAADAQLPADYAPWHPSEIYDDNYTVVNNYTKAEQLPGFWAGAAPVLSTTSGTPSPDGSAAAIPLNGQGDAGPTSCHVGVNFSSVERGAEALVFWYSLPYTGEGEVPAGGLYNMYINVSGSTGAHGWIPITFVYTDNTVIERDPTPAPRDFKLGTSGYAIIEAQDLIDDASQKPFDVSEITNIDFQHGGYQASVQNETLYIDDIGAVKDLDAFKAKLQAIYDPQYTTKPLTPGTGLTVEANAATTTADVSWNAFDGAASYVLNYYTIANNEYVFQNTLTTDQVSGALDSLRASTDYALQVVALDAAGSIVGASNVLPLTTEAESTPDPEPDPNAPPFYNDNYVVVNGYTNASRLPTAWGNEPFTTPALSTNSGTPSPDGSSAALPLNEYANSCFYIDNAFSSAPADAEALVFWYSLPYTGEAETVPAGYYNPNVHVIASEKLHNYVAVDFVFTDGTNREGVAGYPQDFTLGTSGYAIIRAEDLTNDNDPAEKFPISEITRLIFQAGNGSNTGNETLYIDDIGYVKDVDAFVAAITAKHDVSALDTAVSKAEAKAEADYTAETWAPFAAVLQDAKAVLADLSDKTVLYKASTATADMARVLAALEEKEALLEEVEEPDPGPGPEPEPDLDPNSPYATLYGDNYVVLNNFASEEDLPEGWGSGALEGAITTEANSPSIHAAALPLNTDGNNSYHVYADFGAAPSDAEGIAFWYSLPGDADMNGYYSAYVNVYNKNGGLHAWTPLTFVRQGESKPFVGVVGPQDFTLNTTGYAFIDAKYLVDDATGEPFSVSDIRTIDIQHSSTVGAAGKTLYIDDVAAIMDKTAFLEKAGSLLFEGGDEPGPGPDFPGGNLGELYDDNYAIINDFTKEEQIPAGWGNGALGGSLTGEAGSPSPDGSAASLPLNNNANNSWYVRGDFASAAEGAEGLAFWYSLPYSRTDETGTGYYNVYVNITTNTGKAHNWTPVTFIRRGSETVGAPGTQDFVLNTWGYAIIDAKDLVDDATGEPFAISEIDNIAFQAAGTAQNTAGKTLYIDDLGVVTDLNAFKNKVKTLINPSYMVGPLPAGEAITLKAEAQGTFVDAKWNAFEGAYRYYVNLYTVDGETYTFVKTDTTRNRESTISGLTVSTAYAVQVLALNVDEEIVSVSNVVAFTTLAENVPEYMNGPLPYDETMIANGVNINGQAATILWDWVDGVYSYKVYLYRKENGTPVFVSEAEADFGDGSATFLNLDANTTYLAQVVAYDISESIIFAYTPREFDLAGGNNSGGNGGEKPVEPAPTGYAAPLAILMLSVGAAAVLVATRKRKG